MKAGCGRKSRKMAVKVRLARAGGKHRPFYKIVVADERAPRDGAFLEQVGTYDPKVERAGESPRSIRKAWRRGSPMFPV